jgi:hypothetical protein
MISQNASNSTLIPRFVQNGPNRILLTIRQDNGFDLTIALSNEQLCVLVMEGADIVRERMRHGLYRLEEAISKMKEERGDA